MRSSLAGAAVLLMMAGAAAGQPEMPPVASASADLDGSGVAKIEVLADGVVTVTTAAGPAKASTDGRGAVGTLEAQRLAGHGVVAVRWKSGRVAVLEYAKRALSPLFQVAPPEGATAALVLAGGQVLVYETTPVVWRCGGDDVPVLAKRWDFGKGALVAAEAPAAPAGAPATKLKGRVGAAPSSLRATGPLGGYHFEVASAAVREADDLEAPPAPVELGDGNPATVWRQRAKNGGVLSARAADARFGIVALRLVPGVFAPPRTTKVAPPDGLPRRLVASFEDHSKIDVELPATAKDPIWIELPSPVHSRCLSVELSGPGPGTIAVGELEAWSELDLASGTGIDLLVAEIEHSGMTGHDAVRRLKTLGAEAVPRVLAAYGKADGGQKLRLALAMVELAPPDQAASYLVEALAGGHQTDELTVALHALGPAATPALAAALADAARPDEVRILVAGLLGQAADPAAAQALASGLVAPGTLPVRQAIARAASKSPAVELPGLLADAWATAATDVATETLLARAARGQVARDGAGADPLGQRVIDRLGATLSGGDGAYPLRFHLIRAAGRMWEHGAAAAGPALEGVLAKDKDPVLREAALAELLRHPTPELAAAVLAAVRDRNPAVRAAAAAWLGRSGGPAGHVEVRRMLVKEGWTFAREGAAAALAEGCAHGGKLEAADVTALVATGSNDGADSVRIAALRGLVGCNVPEATTTLVAIARDSREEASMRIEAVGLMGLVKDPAIGPPLLGILADASANAPYSDGATQQAIAAAGALSRLCPVGADAALSALAKDPDPGLAQAGSRALAQCRVRRRP